MRRGSSYAQIDLGLGTKMVYTRPGDLLVSVPSRGTAFHILEDRELTLLQVEPDFALKLLRRAGGSDFADLEPLLLKPVREPLVAEIIRRLEDRSEPGTGYHEWSIGLVMHALLREARKRSARPSRRDVSPDKLDEVLASVRARPDLQWSVDRLSEVAGLPRRVFAAMFKTSMGMPVHQYVMRLRADRAVDLLQSTDLSLVEVAARAGFSHQAHLTRVLGRLKGRTPSEIRKARSVGSARQGGPMKTA